MGGGGGGRGGGKARGWKRWATGWGGGVRWQMGVEGGMWIDGVGAVVLCSGRWFCVQGLGSLK